MLCRKKWSGSEDGIVMLFVIVVLVLDSFLT